MTRLVLNNLFKGVIICATLLAGGYLLLVNTAWGHLIDNAAFFGQPGMASWVIAYDHSILGAVNSVTLALAGLSILIIGVIRRTPLAAIITVIGFACAVSSAEFLKHILPWHALVPGDTKLEIQFQRETYPSGHTTIGTSFAIALIFISSARWRPWLAVLAGFMSASFATAVVFSGWHRPSDALGGIFLSGLCMSTAAAVTLILRGYETRSARRGLQPLICSGLLGTAVVAVAWLAAARGRHGHPEAGAPFFIFTLLIIAAAFTLCAWLGWQLRSLDWHLPRRTSLSSPRQVDQWH
ncbi:MAG TPA: phosphatase PAP2 family protein [Terrimicrobiaceae bacterium]